jgi:predicted AlkP superfamily pyrophosphatase or phosphodiesterase
MVHLNREAKKSVQTMTGFLIIILAGSTVNLITPPIYKTSDINWEIKHQNITYSSQTPTDLYDEQNTVGEDQQYIHQSNQNIVTSNKTNVLVISIDGFSRQRFNQYKEKLTTINNLLNQGWSQFNVTNYSYYTHTRNGHATILSGYLGSDTGIYGNSYVYSPLPVGYTFLEKAEKKYGQNRLASAFISGKYKNMYPAFNQTALEELDYVHIQEHIPEKTGKLSLDFLEKYGKQHFSAFFHFRDPDKTGHKSKEGSSKWLDSLSIVDEQINGIISKLNQTKVLDRTYIYITTDHGFKKNRYTHQHEPDIWLLTNDKNTSINIDNSVIGLQDIAPTICYNLDLPYNYSNIQKGHPLQREYPQEKITFRQKYLKNDNSPPFIDIVQIESIVSYLKIMVQVSEDVNQLYLFYDPNNYAGSMLAEKRIPLETSTITLEIDREYLIQYDTLYLIAYDFSENYSIIPIKTN